MDLLTHEEIAYIDEYHERVYREVSPLLNEPGEKNTHPKAFSHAETALFLACFLPDSPHPGST
jgi:hypothetical protein